MRQLLTAIYLQTKRTVKSKGFIILFVFIILVGLSSPLFTSEKTGFLNIVLYNEDGGEASKDITESLVNDNGIIKVTEVFGEDEAISAVEKGNADAAWILRDGIDERISSYPKTKKPVAEAVEKDNNIFMKLAREKLYAALFKKTAYSEYLYFLRRANDEEDVSVAAEKYDEVYVRGNIIDINCIGSLNDEENSFILSPLRGILYLTVALTALAAEIYYIIDRCGGAFGMLSPGHRQWAEAVYIAVPTFWSGVAVSIALLFTGLYTSFLTESVIMLLTVISASAFASVIGSLLGEKERVAPVIPLIITAQAILSPIFADFNGIDSIKKLFPVYHSLSSVYDISSLKNFAIYSAIIIPISVALGYFRERIRQRGKNK